MIDIISGTHEILRDDIDLQSAWLGRLMRENECEAVILDDSMYHGFRCVTRMQQSRQRRDLSLTASLHVVHSFHSLAECIPNNTVYASQNNK